MKLPLTGSARSCAVRFSCTCLFVSALSAIDKVETNIFFGLVVLVDFHLILSVFSFRLIVLLWGKDACLIALFHRDWVGFTSLYSSTSSSTSFIETSDSDFVRSMADMVGNEGDVAESEKGVIAGIIYTVAAIRETPYVVGGGERMKENGFKKNRDGGGFAKNVTRFAPGSGTGMTPGITIHRGRKTEACADRHNTRQLTTSIGCPFDNLVSLPYFRSNIHPDDDPPGRLRRGLDTPPHPDRTLSRQEPRPDRNNFTR